MSEKKRLEKCCNPNPVSNVVAVFSPDTGDLSVTADVAVNKGCKYLYVVIDLRPDDDQAVKVVGFFVHVRPVEVSVRWDFSMPAVDPGDDAGDWKPRVAVMADCGLCPFVEGAVVEAKIPA